MKWTSELYIILLWAWLAGDLLSLIFSFLIYSLVFWKLPQNNFLERVHWHFYIFFFFLKKFTFFYLFIYLFMTVLGLRFCARAFSSCGKWGPLFIAVRRRLTIAASLVAEHRLQTHRLSNCGSRAQLLRGMWDLPRPGLEPVSPALAGRFSTTAPPGKPRHFYILHIWRCLYYVLMLDW